METMTKEYLLHYLESQALVNQIVIEEARRRTYEERWQDLEMLFLGGHSSGWSHELEEEEEEEEEEERVRQLWARLNEKLGGKDRNGAEG
ncbi:MAG: hypothetical protein ACREEM_22150 [Blastocatellia bacterium]